MRIHVCHGAAPQKTRKLDSRTPHVPRVNFKAFLTGAAAGHQEPVPSTGNQRPHPGGAKAQSETALSDDFPRKAQDKKEFDPRMPTDSSFSPSAFIPNTRAPEPSAALANTNFRDLVAAHNVLVNFRLGRDKNGERAHLTVRTSPNTTCEVRLRLEGDTVFAEMESADAPAHETAQLAENLRALFASKNIVLGGIDVV